MPPPTLADAGFAAPATAPVPPLPIPRYLEQVYWWAYVHPNAVQFFEREWLVNLILFGNYGRLRDAALDDLGETITGNTLQVACAYGNITPRLRVHRRLGISKRFERGTRRCLILLGRLSEKRRVVGVSFRTSDVRIDTTRPKSTGL